MVTVAMAQVSKRHCLNRLQSLLGKPVSVQLGQLVMRPELCIQHLHEQALGIPQGALRYLFIF